MSNDALNPTGAVVRYHGSKRDAHGEYVVFELCPCLSCFDTTRKVTEGRVALAEVADQVRYRLGEIGQGVEHALDHVRRSSFTVVSTANDISHF